MDSKRRKTNHFSNNVFYFHNCTVSDELANHITAAGGRILSYHGCTVTHVALPAKGNIPDVNVPNPNYPPIFIDAASLPAITPFSTLRSSGVALQAQPILSVSELYCDKYRPKSCVDIIGQEAAITNLQSWLRAWNTPPGPAKRVFFLSGPPGVGKTALAFAAAHDMNRTILSITTKTELLSAAAAKPPQTILLLDDFDMFPSADRGAIFKLIQTAALPILCVGEEPPSNPGAFVHSALSPIPIQKMVARLRFIMDHERKPVTVTYLEQVASAAHGDMRYALNSLFIGGAPIPRDTSDAMNKTLRSLSSAATVSALLHVAPMLSDDEEDASLYSDYAFPSAVFNCYADRKHIMDVAAAADFLATGDRIRTVWKSTQNYALEQAAGTFSCVLPMFRRGNHTISHISSIPRPLQLEKLYYNASDVVSCSLSGYYMDYVPRLLRFLQQPLVQGAAEEVAAVLLTYRMNYAEWEQFITQTVLIVDYFKIFKIDAAVKKRLCDILKVN